MSFLLDTLETVERFCLPDHKILLVDDSAHGLGAKAQEMFPDVDVFVLRAPGDDDTRMVSHIFFEKIALSIRYAVETYRFKVLVRIDTDALMCNPGADRAAIEFFEKNPGFGMVGSHRVRCDGDPRVFADRGEIIESEAGGHIFPAKRALAAAMRQLLSPALANGYEMGENIIAPGSIMSWAAASKLCESSLFGDPAFRATRLGDDHLISLMLRAFGFDLGDFATGDKPLAVWLRHLQWSPEEIVKRGKAIAHSTRGYKDLDESHVRLAFKALRESGPV
jgi:hypothetical protein